MTLPGVLPLGVTRKCVTRSQKTAKVMFPPVLPPHQCCFSLPKVSHILDTMACEGCRHGSVHEALDDVFKPILVTSWYPIGSPNKERLH